MMIKNFNSKNKTGLCSNDNNNNNTNIINNQNGFRSSSFKVNQSSNNKTTPTTRQIPITVITSNNNTNTPSSQSNYHQNHYNHQQQQQNRYSDLSSLSLLHLKKGISASSSFQNKVNLYSNNQLSDISIDPDPSLTMQQSTHSASSPLGYHYHTDITNHQTSMENLLTTVPSRRPLSTNLNTANINRFIRPKLAVNASSTSTSNLANTSSSSSCGGDVFKPPLPQQSRSTFSMCFYFVFIF